MGYCKDCGNWNKTSSDQYHSIGECACLNFDGVQLHYRGNKLHLLPARTWDKFGCVPFFEERPKGPFTTNLVGDTWYVNANFPKRQAWIHESYSECDAKRIAALLNEEWAIAKGEGESENDHQRLELLHVPTLHDRIHP